MGKKMIEVLTCDFDSCEQEGALTVRVSGNDLAEDASYELELCDEHWLNILANARATTSKRPRVRTEADGDAKRRQTLGHRVKSQRPGETLTAAHMRERAERKAIRQWARANGHQVGDKGYLPNHIRDLYANRSQANGSEVDPAKVERMLTPAGAEYRGRANG